MPLSKLPTYTPSDPNFKSRIRDSFNRQQVMKTIGATLTGIASGEVIIELPCQENLTQQHGFIHAGIVTTILDSACGYAALSLMPVGSAVLTVEFKVNFMSPAEGTKLIAHGKVIKPGQTITVCTASVSAVHQGSKKLVAVMQATMMRREDGNIKD